MYWYDTYFKNSSSLQIIEFICTPFHFRIFTFLLMDPQQSLSLSLSLSLYIYIYIYTRKRMLNIEFLQMVILFVFLMNLILVSNSAVKCSTFIWEQRMTTVPHVPQQDILKILIEVKGVYMLVFNSESVDKMSPFLLSFLKEVLILPSEQYSCQCQFYLLSGPIWLIWKMFKAPLGVEVIQLSTNIPSKKCY